MPPAVRRFTPGALRAAADRFASGGFSFSRTCSRNREPPHHASQPHLLEWQGRQDLAGDWRSLTVTALFSFLLEIFSIF